MGKKVEKEGDDEEATARRGKGETNLPPLLDLLDLSVELLLFGWGHVVDLRERGGWGVMGL